MDVGSVELAHLNQRAAAGDDEAASEYLRVTLPLLRSMAHRIVSSPLDPDDVLSEALFRLLRRWEESRQPAEFAHAYVIKTMRNIVIDEARSPRSRVVSLSEDVPSSRQMVAEREVELSAEFELVREALGALSADQRHVLREIVENGRKPGAVAEEMQRSPAAVSNLLQRAKTSLRRHVLVASLRRGDTMCTLNAADIPRTPVIDPTHHDPSEPGMAHILGCVACRRNWSRWAGLASALSVSALVVIAEQVHPSPAAALDVSPEAPGDSRERRVRTAVITAAAAAIAGGVILLGIAISPRQPHADFQVVAEDDRSLDVSFRVDAESWRADRIVIALEGATLVSTPPEWNCVVSAASADCAPSAGPIDGRIGVAANSPAAAATYRLSVDATSGSFHIDGDSNGPLGDRER